MTKWRCFRESAWCVDVFGEVLPKIRTGIKAMERLRSHPLPHWVERMTVGYVRSQGGAAFRKLTGWDITWPDGQKQLSCTFTTRENRIAPNIAGPGM